MEKLYRDDIEKLDRLKINKRKKMCRFCHVELIADENGYRCPQCNEEALV